MRRLAFIFVLAVLTPALALAWLALRSLRDQQIVSERQRTLLYQGICNGVVKDVTAFMEDRQAEFARQVEALIASKGTLPLAGEFDHDILQVWPLAKVGFAVTLEGQVLSPPLLGRPAARQFRVDNELFLCSRQSVEVYWHSPKGDIPLSTLEDKSGGKKDSDTDAARKSSLKDPPDKGSRLVASEAEFKHLIGDANSGTVARFLQNKLNLLVWSRTSAKPDLIYGAELKLDRLVEALRPLIQTEDAFKNELCLALLDDTGQAVGRSRPEYNGDWKHPVVAAEVGDMLPHWQVAAYVLDPARLTQSAQTVALTLGLLVCLLLLAIGVGSWLIVTDLRRQLLLARQKTDFVSNVSHELKTPLTSIRMFSELLAEGRVLDLEKQRTYLGVIASESARLTRLINNVLDFARRERGEKKYDLQPCDLAEVVRGVAETYRPHLEAAGFRFECRLPNGPVPVHGDKDALAQVIVNLLSNAEKYSGPDKQILLELTGTAELSHFQDRLTPPQESIVKPEGGASSLEEGAAQAKVRVLDRGLGIPDGCADKIFEQFYRAHDSLSSGIPGSGLGLTLARQIARAHEGDVRYEPRAGGGSCFELVLPLA